MTTRSRTSRMDQAREALLGSLPKRSTEPVAHEADGMTTSRRVPSLTAGRPLNRSQRDALTGVPTDPARQGWTTAVALPHLCQPPRQYPQNCGPGSAWTCRCAAVWISQGIDLNPDGEGYGLGPDRNDAVVLVERWFYQSGGNAAVCLAQQELYDWRPLGPYFVKLGRLILDTMQQRDGNTTWEDLG